MLPLTMKELNLGPKFVVSGSGLVANVIATAIKTKEYPTLPRKADVIVEKVTAVYKKEFKENFSGDYYQDEFNGYPELLNWLYENIASIPEIEELSITQAMFEAGFRIDDPDPGHFTYVQLQRPREPEKDDFVDIHAYTRNLAQALIKDCICIDFSTFPGARHYKPEAEDVL